MVSTEESDLVIEYLTQHSKRPITAVRVWTLCLQHISAETGEILLRREALAGQIGVRSGTISDVMTELEQCGAIFRKRERIAALRGRGIVRYFLHPRLAEKISDSERT